MEKKVSVIVVTFQRFEYLKLTLESILAQTYTNFELIVVSDGYESDVKEYVKSLFESGYSIQYDFTEHCGYPARPRNLALKKCKGEYVAFCDDDDLWESDKLEKQIDVLDRNEDVVLCCTNRDEIDSNGHLLTKKSINYVPNYPTFNKLLFTNFISYSSVLIRKSIIEKSGVFIDDIKFRAVEDYHLWLRVAYYGKVYFLDEIMVHYRKHGGNITSKFSVGIKKNILVYDNIFSTLNVSKIRKFFSYVTVYVKSAIYRLSGK
ncbi:glycosyltransferase [Sphingobacterium spiritivorum]|uniref:glycosyltransferase n=1 Tax=Sphingobacterium spiritivorum TaxID=258 RepID=UPI003DA36024